MSTFSDNIVKLRQSKDLSQRKFADEIGVSKSTVGKWESSDTLPDYERMDAIAEYFGVSVGALFWNELNPIDVSPYKDVKVFGRIAAGTPIEMIEDEGSFPAPTELMRKHPSAFFLEVNGESMNKKLPNGSYALVDPDLKDPIIDMCAYALCINGYDATIKRVKKLENGYELIPDSTDPTIKPSVYDYGEKDTETITVLGKVVWYVVPFDFDI